MARDDAAEATTWRRRSGTEMSEGQQRCTTCRALLDEEDLFCPNCGTETPAGRRPLHEPGVIVATHNFDCRGCGASMSYDASAQALRCPFCGSEELQARQDTKTWAPDRVVPFVIGQQDAVERLRQWLRKGFWRPGDLATAAMVTKMTPVFVPYWVFTAQTYSYWTGDSSQTPPGARGDWYPVSGEHRESFEGVLIGASGALTPAETSALVPFDLAAGVPRDQVDLENVVYEQFRVQRKYARPLAQQSIEALVRTACRKYVPGNCRNLKANVRIEGLSSEAVLLPVWIAAYRYRDRVFRFLLNGQTGRATGQAPTSWRKVVLVVGAVVLCAAVIGIGAALCAGILQR